MADVRWRRAVITLAWALTACSSSVQSTAPSTSLTTTIAAAPAASTTIAITAIMTTTTAVVRSLPLGDGRRSTGPEAGSVFACQTTFGPAGGAFRDGPWIGGNGTWDPTAKLHVQGNVPWPQAEYSLRIEGANRVITSNGVPAQSTTGVFPVDPADPAYQYDRNPNTITPRLTTFTVPAAPAPAATPACLNMGAIGVLIDGVALFNALDAQGRDAAAHEVLDACDGHPERTGQYHHHAIPSCALFEATLASSPVGYALDGFGLYVERHPDGRLLTNADLDACHGRTSPITWDGQIVAMYHFVATLEYPYTVGCYRGTRR